MLLNLRAHQVLRDKAGGHVNRCVFKFSYAGRGNIFFFGSRNCRYKNSTRRVLVWYKKLVPGTMVLFCVFVVGPRWILENSKGVVFV